MTSLKKEIYSNLPLFLILTFLILYGLQYERITDMFQWLVIILFLLLLYTIARKYR